MLNMLQDPKNCTSSFEICTSHVDDQEQAFHKEGLWMSGGLAHKSILFKNLTPCAHHFCYIFLRDTTFFSNVYATSEPIHF